MVLSFRSVDEILATIEIKVINHYYFSEMLVFPFGIMFINFFLGASGLFPQETLSTKLFDSGEKTLVFFLHREKKVF